MSEHLTYQKAGVDPEKAAALITDFKKFQKSRPQDPNLLSGIGPFAACYALGPFLKDLKDPVLVTCCDGVGTKLKLALDWNRISDLGQDLVAMNVNDLLCTGAKPMLFLDYYACGALRPEQWTTILKSIQNACELAQCTLVGGETAEMPGLYSGEDFDLAGFSVGIVDREKILSPDRVNSGDMLIGIPSSGVHSNGFSLVRKLIEKEKIRGDATAPFENRTWSEILLAPTHLYTRALSGIFPKINALAHITGGGLFENLPRALPSGLSAKVDSKLWKMPALFEWMREKASLSYEEILSTFNCGIGMIAIVDPKSSDAVLAHLKSHGFESRVIGRVEENSTPVQWV